MEDTVRHSCTSKGFAQSEDQERREKRLETYNEVLRRLRDLKKVAEASVPGFEDELRTHFMRFCLRYALNLDVERAEDVLLHKRLLKEAENPATTSPVIEVRLVEIHATSDGNRGQKVKCECSGVSSEERLRHEVTIATKDKLKLFSRLTNVLDEVGLLYHEVHAFTTTDGYFLGVFCGDCRSYEGVEQLKHALVAEMSKLNG
ncbi:hypothetical protein SLA2020_094980 [Shorea laevis]